MRGKSVMLLAGLASLAQANELNPYIYHAIQYNFTDYFAVESGIIIPSVFVISIQWSFR